MNTQNTIQKTFNYEGNAITFQSGKGVMVNATEMAKPFGKSARGWLRNQQSEEFINELAALRNCNATDLVVVKNGGNNFGTWMHEDVALEFARWLSPKFAIWCNDRIKELLTNGVAYNIPQTYADALALAADQARKIEQQEKMIVAAKEVISEQQTEIAEQKPKADYYDEVLQQQNTYTFTDIAKELGMRSGHELIERLTNRGIIYRKYGKVLAYVKYSKQGYFTTRTDLYTTPDGRRGINYATVVTEKGREWMHTDYQLATQTTLSL